MSQPQSRTNSQDLHPHWPFPRLETGRFATFMANGSYGFRVASEAPADVPPDLSPAVRASVYC